MRRAVPRRYQFPALLRASGSSLVASHCWVRCPSGRSSGAPPAASATSRQLAAQGGDTVIATAHRKQETAGDRPRRRRNRRLHRRHHDRGPRTPSGRRRCRVAPRREPGPAVPRSARAAVRVHPDHVARAATHRGRHPGRIDANPDQATLDRCASNYATDFTGCTSSRPTPSTSPTAPADFAGRTLGKLIVTTT